MKKNSVKTVIMAIVWLVPVLAWAQDSIAGDVIRFEYDEGGAIVRKEVIMEDGQEEYSEMKKSAKARKRNDLKSQQVNHLVLGSGTEVGIIKVLLPNYTDYTERSLTVHNLSGILQYTMAINDATSIIDLRHLSQGVYVATLMLDDEKEVRKVRR